MGRPKSHVGHDFRRLAGRQLADYDGGSPGSIFSEPGFDLTVDEAYLLQIEIARMRRARGEVVAGYKIGCVSETVRRQLAVDHPVFGHVFQSEIHSSPARLDHASFCQPGIEGEIGVVLNEDVASPAALMNAPGRFVGEILPVIELHNYVFRGPGPTAAELVANNALHAGVVIGPGPARAGAGNPFRIRVEINGKVSESPTYDPCETVCDLVSRLAEHGIQPRKGDILLTGSPLPLYAVSPGDSVKVNCRGFAPVEALLRAG